MCQFPLLKLNHMLHNISLFVCFVNLFMNYYTLKAEKNIKNVD